MNACSPAMARSMSDRIVPDRAIRLRIASVDRTSTTSQTRSERNVQSPWVQHESNNNRHVNIGADHFQATVTTYGPTGPQVSAGGAQVSVSTLYRFPRGSRPPRWRYLARAPQQRHQGKSAATFGSHRAGPAESPAFLFLTIHRMRRAPPEKHPSQPDESFCMCTKTHPGYVPLSENQRRIETHWAIISGGTCMALTICITNTTTFNFSKASRDSSANPASRSKAVLHEHSVTTTACISGCVQVTGWVSAPPRNDTSARPRPHTTTRQCAVPNSQRMFTTLSAMNWNSRS